jgi:hypothetical protein
MASLRHLLAWRDMHWQDAHAGSRTIAIVTVGLLRPRIVMIGDGPSRFHYRMLRARRRRVRHGPTDWLRMLASIGSVLDARRGYTSAWNERFGARRAHRTK